MENQLGNTYAELYKPYYRNHGIGEKRALSAQDVLSHVQELVGTRRFPRIVDVGAGEGSLLQLLQACGLGEELYALEISESGCKAIEDRKLSSLKESRQFDGYQIPYPDKAFDLALFVHVLEHVEHERLMLRELRRVARQVVIEVPLEFGVRVDRSIALSGRYGHINFYSPTTFLNLLRTAGFRVLRSRVFTPSLAYERYCAGPTRGLMKHLIRRGMLAASQRIAPLLMTYVMSAYCEPE